MHGASHEVLGRLAMGGMAELYLARTTHEDGRQQVVVLKRILPHLAEDPEFVRMFRDEAFLAATLDHPNIVSVHDIGQDGEDYFFTMEYVHGENVRTIIKAAQDAETTLPLEHVVQIIGGVCDGLHYAHERTDEKGEPLRIVHRDVSPTNILVSSQGRVKIVDFGIAKAAAATHVTQAGMLKGKASYMSPEQCRAQPVDRRSDVFAIGILLYEMTTLTRLFRGDNELAVLHQILTGEVEPPSTRVDDYDPELERIVMRALAEKADDRYPTAQAMREDLDRYKGLRGLSSSEEALGRYLRELCGEKPVPWDTELDPDDLELLDQSTTGMPTAMGNLEDDEDTQVNRKAPQLPTLVPGAPETWTEKPPPRDAPPATSAPPSTSRPTPARGAARGLNPHRPRLPGAPRGMGIPPPSSVETVAPPGRTDPRAESTTPMAKPSIARAPGPRRPARRGGPAAGGPGKPASGRPPPRRGRTLPGSGGGLAGPAPPRSGRTLPGQGKTGGADRTMAAGAGSRPRPPTGAHRPRRGPSGSSPGASPGGSPEASPGSASPTPGTASGPSAWSGPGVDRTELAPPTLQALTPHAPTPQAPTPQAEVDEGARTLAMPRFDRTMLVPPGQELPQGPMNWNLGQPQPPGQPPGQSEDPLTTTQKAGSPLARISTVQAPPSALTATQENPGSLTSTQRSPSAAYPTVGTMGPIPNNELRRPEMRSPSPRPASTPRSLWVPVLIVVIVILAGTAVWLWLSSAGATPSGARRSEPTPSPTTEPSPTAPSTASDPSTAPAEAVAPGPPGSRGPAVTDPADAPGSSPDQPGSDTTEAPGSEPTAAPGSEPAAAPGSEPAAEPTSEPSAPNAGQARPRRPRRPATTGSSPDPDLPEIKPGRPVPP